MNYLAHAFLSFNEPEIIVGNMISDFVKGKKKFDYPQGIQKGIALHRAIDQFTDDHPQTKIAKEYFRPVYRLYSGAFVDVLYDYFLANDRDQFAGSDALDQFTANTYESIEKYLPILPANFQHLFPFMKTQNWLFNYQYQWGLEKSFGGLIYRALYLHESAQAMEIFQANENALQYCYNNFFPELYFFAKHQLRNLLDS
ncbi:MAG: ACP phosphodiesterase [Chitinophagaceae bacterium]